ncbi:MAG: PAS domain-containing protein [Alphaproteobacteria bacterium]|nr:PAS domain-containing protein [Alphaproteobacteria bacterium]
MRGYSAGAVDYVPVPVVPDVLRAKVRIFTELYRKTRMLEELNRDLESRVWERTAALEASAARLRDSERGRTLALAAGNMGSWEYLIDEDSWSLDEGQYRIFELEPPKEDLPRGYVRSLFHPDDWEGMQRAWRRATPSEPSFQQEIRIVRASGETRWGLVAAAVTFGAEGQPQRISGVTVDITDRKEAERRQLLLAREVDHRARNALAVVQAIVRLGRSKSVEEYIAAVEGRVRALSLSHDLLSQSRWQGADIGRLVAEEFAPYQVDSERRAVFSGPSIILPADRAQSVALVIHELATNAAKYGALSSSSGRVDLRWDIRDGFLILDWTETGGPVVEKPTAKGLGTKIIESTVQHHKGDHASFDWRPQGLRFKVALCLVPRHESVSSTSAADTATSLEPQKRQILVVEDEPLVGMWTNEVLDDLGYKVLGPCLDLAEAHEAIAATQVDGAVLDVNLAGVPIFPFARLLLERGVPVVFLTGYEKTVLDSPFNRAPLLQKPIAAEDLVRALETVLGPSPQRRRLLEC